MPVLNHVLAVYKLWQDCKKDFPRDLRYTLGEKMDRSILSALEYIFIASYQAKDKKLPIISAAIVKVDLLKFFLRISWELKALDNKKYIAISEKVDEVGRMLGGWRKGLESKTPQL